MRSLLFKHRLTAAGWAAAAAAAAATLTGQRCHAAADDGDQQQHVPVDKLVCHRDVPPPRTPTVLVSCGSFNPPTVAHLRMFDLATAALAQRGHDVWGCYMSPVADAYGKQGLAPVQHRVEMCRLAAADTPNVMVDAWEAAQPTYTRTLQVLQHVASSLRAQMQPPQQQQQQQQHPQQQETAQSTPRDTAGTASSAAQKQQQPPDPAAAAQQQPRVMLLCGADLLASFDQPGVWRDPDVILRDHGVVCICRAGTDVDALLQQPGSLLHTYQEHVVVVQEPVANDVSSTRVRQLLAAGQPVRYLVPQPVASYIQQHGLYSVAAAS